jgi:23S rRNA pseudouridine2605 synthase
MRLNKYLALAGVASRRAAEQLIRAATTTVNGKVVLDPAYPVGDEDVVCYDGQRLTLVNRSKVYLLNKPVGVITTSKDPHGRPTVVDFIPHKGRLFPIGRLDKDTTGLLLLTNDGELMEKLLHPRYRVPRIYEVVVDRPLEQREIQKMERGLYIGEGEWGRAKVVKQTTVKKRTTLTLQMTEGKKREVRRLLTTLKRRIFKLSRVQFGPVVLGDLPVGQWRELTPEEIEKLKKYQRR